MATDGTVMADGTDGPVMGDAAAARIPPGRRSMAPSVHCPASKSGHAATMPPSSLLSLSHSSLHAARGTSLRPAHNSDMTQHDLDRTASDPASPSQHSAECTCCVDDADMEEHGGKKDVGECGDQSHETTLRMDGKVECWPACAACCHKFEHRFCAADCAAHTGFKTSSTAALCRDTQQTSSVSSLPDSSLDCNPAHACQHQHDGLRHRPVYRLPPPAVAQSTPPNTTIFPGDDGSGSVIKGLSVVDRFLSVWIILVMIVGVLVGYYSSSAVSALSSVQIVTVSLPVSLGLWLMMYPVLVKVKYEAFGNIFRKRDTYRQLLFSVSANWLIGPLLMLAIAWATLPDLPHYRNGVIMVGLARCIAMVLIWNQLARGDPEYCAILVAVNSVLQIILYAPLALLFLVVISRQYTGTGESFTLNYWDVCRSVFLFLGVPLIAAVLTRFLLLLIAGHEWFQLKFVPVISPVALIALLWTVFAIFAIQGHNIIDNIGSVCRVAVPMVVYFILMFSTSLAMCRWLQFGYEKAITQAFTASSNNFELAIAVAAATFGVDSPEALAATIGPLVEVPVLLSLVYVALWLKPRLAWPVVPSPHRADVTKPNQEPAVDDGAVQLARCR